MPFLRHRAPERRLEAVRAMTDPGTIPALEAMRRDRDPDVAQQVKQSLEWLRSRQKEEATSAVGAAK